MDEYSTNHCYNQYQPIEHGKEESWRKFLNAEKGVWLVNKIAEQLGINMSYGMLGWRAKLLMADYWVIHMPIHTMRRRYFEVINEIRAMINFKNMPERADQRDFWYHISWRRIVEFRNIEYIAKWGDRWMPHYELERVEFAKDHYIYIQGLKKKSKRKWKRRDHDVKDLWDIDVKQQMYGIYGDKEGAPQT